MIIKLYIFLKYLKLMNLFDKKCNFGVKKENMCLMIIFFEKFLDIL